MTALSHQERLARLIAWVEELAVFEREQDALIAAEKYDAIASLLRSGVSQEATLLRSEIPKESCVCVKPHGFPDAHEPNCPQRTVVMVNLKQSAGTDARYGAEQK